MNWKSRKNIVITVIIVITAWKIPIEIQSKPVMKSGEILNRWEEVE